MLKNLVFLMVTIIVGLFLVSGCTAKDESMGVQNGDTVKIHYTGTLNDGSVFDSSTNREPLEFKLGTGAVIPGFEKAVTGMKVGETKKVNIPAAEAYGEYHKELTMVVQRSQLPPDIVPQVGGQLQARDSAGRTTVFNITQVTVTSVTVDANHPLAGKDLNFELKLVEIKK